MTNKIADLVEKVTVWSNAVFIALLSTLNPSNISAVIFTFTLLLAWNITSGDITYINEDKMTKEVRKQGLKICVEEDIYGVS